MLYTMKYDLRKLDPRLIGMPEQAAILDYSELYFMNVIREQANVTSAVGKLAVYLTYFGVVAYMADKKLTPPKALLADMRTARGHLPAQELKRMGVPKEILVDSTSKLLLRDQLPYLLRWNRKVRENIKIPENERKLLTMAIRIGKADISDSSLRSLQKVAYTISPELGGKINEYINGTAADGGVNAKKANGTGLASLQAALRSMVKALGGGGLTLAADKAAAAKVGSRTAAKYKEYLALRKDLKAKFEIDFRRMISANNNEPLDVVKAEREMTSKGYDLLFMPTKAMGFTGKVGLNQGKISLYTSGGKLIQGNIAPGSTVLMNKKYDEDNDKAYVMLVKVPGGITKGTRMYTAVQKRASVMSKFKKADEVHTNLPTLLKRWEKDLRSSEPKQMMHGLAGAILYLTGARVGTNSAGMASKKGVAAFGLLNMRVKHVKVTSSNIIFTYPGKKGVPQKHVIPLTKPTQKAMAANLKKMMAGKKPDDMLWSMPSTMSKRMISISYADFNRYLKGIGFTQGAHKLRHVRGTSLVAKLLAAKPWKPSRAANTMAKRKKEAERYMQDKILTEVANKLGHKSTDKATGGFKPAWRTSIQSYVNPNIVRQWFTEHNLDVPSWVPTGIGAD